jgi:UDP-N-acetylglucosamine diphosphorylase/glucosamine-1-phosphate N-acetyltransferase
LKIFNAPLFSIENTELFLYLSEQHHYAMDKDVNIILFDDLHRENLLPLTFTRPVSDLRIGITTIKEKWELSTGSQCSYYTVDYLSKKYPIKLDSNNLFINSFLIPDEHLVGQIAGLKPNEVLMRRKTVLAFNASKPVPFDELINNSAFRKVEYKSNFLCIRNLWDIFVFNDQVLRDDFNKITSGRKSQPLSNSNIISGAEHIFLEEGTKVECAMLNATTGPIYIGRDVEIMEGSLIRGPFAICEHSTLKMGSKIYGAVTIGPHCKIGGEVNNSVFMAYSNKAHDGFLGNSVLGEWCNIGAGSNNSNLKNNYAEVKLWNYPAGTFLNTGLQFCGLIMGDHSKCGINSMFNTATVIGVSSNIFGSGFPSNFIPSFSWGGAAGFIAYQPAKAIETAEIVMKRRNIILSDNDKEILNTVFNHTEKYRDF